MPSATRRSKLTSAGFPANADWALYGELPYPVGPTGSICHQLCPAAARKSTISRAVAPRSSPDRLVGCRSTPLVRSMSFGRRNADISLTSLIRLGAIFACYSSLMGRVLLGLLKGGVVG